MSTTATDTAAASTDAASSAASTAPPSYSLVSSYSTVQQLSPTLVNNVVYCSIQTQPSGVIASLPVEERVFNDGQAGVPLSNFANAIEVIMSDPRVIAGAGNQMLDQQGLLSDLVTFTVEYRDPVHAPNGATAQVSIGAGSLNFTDGQIGQVLLGDATASIDKTYANLKAASGG